MSRSHLNRRQLVPTSLGKRVRGSVYVHRGLLDWLPPELRTRAEAALLAAGSAAHGCNVLRFDSDGRTALLLYGRFDEEPFPPLENTWLVDSHGTVRHRQFRGGANPPILHRKELLLTQDDSRRARFARLTSELEARGLFRDAHRIGRYRCWKQRLAEAGVKVENYRILEADCEE